MKKFIVEKARNGSTVALNVMNISEIWKQYDGSSVIRMIGQDEPNSLHLEKNFDQLIKEIGW